MTASDDGRSSFEWTSSGLLNWINSLEIKTLIFAPDHSGVTLASGGVWMRRLDEEMLTNVWNFDILIETADGDDAHIVFRWYNPRLMVSCGPTLMSSLSLRFGN